MARVASRKGDFPHIQWVDLGNGLLTEVAVLKEDGEGNVYFFELNKLDAIDRQRLFNIITKRHAGQFPLWDLLNQHTLGNGMNALNYFHQLVKVVTANGQVMDPKQGVIGARAGTAPLPAEAPAAETVPAAEQQG